jgi:hypothetical protein
MDIHVSSLMTILDMVMCIWWKSKSSESFKEHRNTIEIQINKKSINILWWHLGGEYFIQDFQDYLKKNRIPSQWIPPRTSRHNRVSERRNCTLLDMVRSMISYVDLLPSL